METFLLYILVPLLGVCVICQFLWIYYFAHRRGICTRAMYDQLLGEFRAHQAHGTGLTLQEVQDHLNKWYTANTGLEATYSTKAEVQSLLGNVENFISADEVDKKIEAAKAGLSPAAAPAATPAVVSDAELGVKVDAAVAKALAAPDKKVTRVMTATPPDPATIPDQPSLLLLEGKADKALLGVGFVLQYARHLDAAVIAQFRAPIETEVKKLQREIKDGHDPLKKAKFEAERLLRDRSRKRLKKDISLRELNREAEKYVEELELDDLQDQSDALRRYQDGREDLRLEREAAYREAKQDFEEAEAALDNFTVNQETEARLTMLCDRLEKFDALAEVIVKLARALDPDKNSIRPPAPSPVPAKRRSRRPVRPKAKVSPHESTVTAGFPVGPPADDGGADESDIEMLGPDSDPDSIDLSSLPPPADDGSSD
jgi:hypothetical protein